MKQHVVTRRWAIQSILEDDMHPRLEYNDIIMLLREGHKGYDNFTKEELKERYNKLFIDKVDEVIS